MKLVNVTLFARAYYSEAEYEDNIWIKAETYEKIKEDIPEEIYCGELDGKHSETCGEVDFQTFDGEAEIATYSNGFKLYCDGDHLRCALEGVYEEHKINFAEEQKEIENYIESLDYLIDVEVRVKKSNRDKMLEFAKNLM